MLHNDEKHRNNSSQNLFVPEMLSTAFFENIRQAVFHKFIMKPIQHSGTLFLLRTAVLILIMKLPFVAIFSRNRVCPCQDNMLIIEQE